MTLRLTGFTLAGLIAGMLSCALVKMPFAGAHDKVYFFVGAMLGFALPIYLWFFEDRRSLRRVLVFLIASTCAYYGAMTAGLFSMRALTWLKLSLFGINREETTLMLVGGFLGAAMVYLAFALLYCHGLRIRAFFLCWILIALLGSLLAIAGYALGAHLAHPNSDAQIYTLYIVWQGLISVALGYLLIQSESRS